MAMTKLTLSAEKELIREAKQLAEESGTSLSSMFARFIRAALQERGCIEEPGRLTRQALGLVMLPSGKTDREVIEEALAERFSKS